MSKHSPVSTLLDTHVAHVNHLKTSQTDPRSYVKALQQAYEELKKDARIALGATGYSKATLGSDLAKLDGAMHLADRGNPLAANLLADTATGDVRELIHTCLDSVVLDRLIDSAKTSPSAANEIAAGASNDSTRTLFVHCAAIVNGLARASVGSPGWRSGPFQL